MVGDTDKWEFDPDLWVKQAGQLHSKRTGEILTPEHFALIQEADELKVLFDVQWKRDMEVIKRWHEEGKVEANVFPDRVNMVLMLADERAQAESDAAALRDRVQALEQQVMQQTCAHYWERTGWVSHVKRDWSSTQVGNRPYPVEVMECAKCEALTFEPFERGPYGGKPSYADLEGRVQALETALRWYADEAHYPVGPGYFTERARAALLSPAQEGE